MNVQQSGLKLDVISGMVLAQALRNTTFAEALEIMQSTYSDHIKFTAQLHQPCVYAVCPATPEELFSFCMPTDTDCL